MPTEDEVFAELEASRSRRAAYRAAATPEKAALAGANRGAYGHLRPGDVAALAKAGQGPDSPVTKTVAQARAKHKAKKGFGFHSIGDVISAGAGKVKGGVDFVVPDAVMDVAGSGIGEASQVLKPIARTGFTVLGAPLEEVQGIARAAYAQVNEQGVGAALNPFSSQSKDYWGKAGPSTARLAAGKLLKGEKVNLGSGILPGRAKDDPNTPENEEQLGGEQERLARRLKINGQWISTGRIVADIITEPGTKPYNVLSGVVDAVASVLVDPTNIAATRLTQVRKANKGFVPEEVGLITGRRKTVDVDKAAEFLGSAPGRKVTEALAADGSFGSIMRRTKGKLDVSVGLELEKATTPAEVGAILSREILGGAIREKPTVGGMPFSNPVVRRVTDARIWQALPGRSLDFSDPNAAVATAENYLRNANIKDTEVIDRLVRNVALATQPEGYAGRLSSATALADVVEESIFESMRRGVVRGVRTDDTGLIDAAARERARDLTTFFRDNIESLKGYNQDDLGNNIWFPGAKVNGEGIPGASPHLVVEGLNHAVPLPKTRDIRMATSRFSKLLIEHPNLKVPGMTLDYAQQTIWKPLVLIRGAWTIRVVGEEQLRMAGAGFSSFASNPLSALAWVVGQDTRKGRALAKVGIKTGRGDTDIMGEAFADAARNAPEPTAFEDALYKGKAANPAERANTVSTSHRARYDKGHPQYNLARADELLRLRSDPIGRRVAMGGLEKGDLAPAVAQATPPSSALSKAKEYVSGEAPPASAVPGARPGIDGIKDWFWEGTGRKVRQDKVKMSADQATAPTTRELSDAYIDTVVDRLARSTGGDDVLVRAVATGKYSDEFLDVSLRDGEFVNHEFEKLLKRHTETGPSTQLGDLVLSQKDQGAELGAKAKSVVNAMFAQLMARPSNGLSRSPVFKQSYWQRSTELIADMEPVARAATLDAARAAKLPKATIERMESLASTKAGTLTLDEADLLAKGHALETTRDLLYDLSQKGQFADQLRLISPFAEAWKEVLTRWGRIVVENPKVVRRAQQGVEGARGAGWFRPDPTTGEEVFEYPGSGFVTEHLLGVRAPMMGRVAGLSLATSILPGFGPVVQYPASKLIPNRPEWDGIRQAFLPFGEPDTEGGVVESFLPAWMQKFRTAVFRNDPEQDRMFANTVMDVARYLVSTGEYSTNSPDEVERLMATATSKAKAVYILRGASQFFAPSAPTPQFLAQDKQGKFMVAQKLVEEYRKLQDADYDTATEKFIETYGEEALLFMQPKTTGGAPSTTELGDWARDHPTQVKKFTNVYGYFGPTGGDFDINFYGRQLKSGERKAITPKEAVALANQRVASMAWRQAKAQMEGRTDKEAKVWLASVRDQLLVEYPGYDPMPKDLGKSDRLVREVQAAVKDPVMAGTEAGKGISLYLQAREMAAKAARDDLGLTAGFGRAKSARYLREYLRGVGAEVVKEYPAFAAVFEQVFEREMTDDAPDEQEDAA